jgi:arginyl-tRNA synthetase
LRGNPDKNIYSSLNVKIWEALSFVDLLDEISSILRPHVDEYLKGVELDLQEPSVAEFGDLASGASFKISKHVKKSPDEISRALAAKISIPEGSLVSKVEARNGYVNFWIDTVKFSKEVIKATITKGESYGVPRVLDKRRVLIEHTNSNPNKALHIGVARNTVLGDTLCRLLKYVGNEVVSVNYIDDSGSQVADNLLAHLVLNVPEEPPMGKRFDVYAGEVYANVNKRIGSDPALEQEKRKIIKEVELGLSDTAKFAREFAERVVKEQLKTCWRLGAYFDLLNWESDILRSGMFDEVMKRLKELGRVEVAEGGKNSGCLIIKLRDVKEFENLTDPDEVLVRSDGTVTYVGKDIAYAAWKLGLVNAEFKYKPFVEQPGRDVVWTTSQDGVSRPPRKFNGVDIAITLVDKRQEHPQLVVSTALRFLSGAQDRYRPYLYELVSLSGETASELTGEPSLASKRVVHMSGRAGLVVNVDDVLDLLESKAKEESLKRNPGIGEYELEAIGKEIARAALRFSLLKTDISNMVVFSTRESLRLDGDSGPYLQYTYARASSILRKIGERCDSEYDTSLLSHETERALVKEISKFPLVVQEASSSLNPRLLATYSLKLADRFNLFYESCQVMHAASQDLKVARTYLVRAFVTIFGKALELLGITPLERM